MMFKKLLLLVIITVFLTNCAYFYAQRDDAHTLVVKWIDEQEFDKASKTLSQVKTTHPQYLDLMLLKKDIKTNSNTFAVTTIKQADFFIKEDKWEDAYVVFDFARKRLANNNKLNFAYNIYLIKRSKYINNLKLKMLINNAERLIKDLPLQRKIAQASKETLSEQRTFNALQAKATKLIVSLSNCTSNLINLNRITQAKGCADLALQLGAKDQVQAKLKKSLTDINTQLAKNKQKKQKAVSDLHLKTLKEYKAAFDKNDLMTANKKLTQLMSSNKDNYELIKLKTILDESINNKLKIGIEAGRVLYSKGNIKLALDKWLALKKLDPENVELKSHISRAERVLRKLHKLTERENNE